MSKNGEIMKLIMSLFLLISIMSTDAIAKCTEWTEKRGYSCSLISKTAKVYERACTNVCWYKPRTRRRRNTGENCEREKVCSFESPDRFRGACSEWMQANGRTCHNPNTNQWEQSWRRVCTNGLTTMACSSETPQI